MSVTQIVHCEAVQGKAEELLALLRGARDLALSADGCEGYDIYQGTDDLQKFGMVERWASVEAHQSHFAKDVKASGVFDRAVALLTGPPEQGYYSLR